VEGKEEIPQPDVVYNTSDRVKDIIKASGSAVVNGSS